MTPDPTPPAPSASPSAGPFVVGLGASAGGITALREFFSHAADAGIAYCVVLHLSPDHDSELAHVLQHTARFPVEQVNGAVQIEAGRVYVIPPNCRLSLSGDTLKVETATADERRVAVDLFFRSLAEARGVRCAAAVLSGSGRNGSSGLKRIKEHGGLTLAQVPETAEYPQMPQNAIATRLIDAVASPAEMPALITAYQQRLVRDEQPGEAIAQDESDALRDVLGILRLRTGHDFSSYKAPTLLRRIRRRELVRQVDSVAQYAAVLRDVPDEAAALMKDLLIGVTRFFRDPGAFDTLAGVALPRLFRAKTLHDHVRVWVSACATGEEAYSVAMLLAEEAALLPEPPRIQVFGTDLDGAAIAVAREGLYSEADVADVGEARLRRFFAAEPGGFRVRRELREMVLFATHNVIRDPPFSHLDLITCRNLLIYLNRSAQEQVLDTFHFALRPGGCLWLGQSESAEVKDSLFVALDKSTHLYEARTATTRLTLGYRDPVELTRALAPPHDAWFSRIPAGVLHQRLLEQYAPPSVVIADDFRVLHVSERAGRYLAISGGEPSQNLLNLVRPELRADLRAAVLQAMRTRESVAIGGLATVLADGVARVALRVRPVLRDGDPPRGLCLVTFEEEGGSVEPVVAPIARGGDPTELEEEITHLRAQLRSTVEQYETQQEESKAGNEELQAMNEELRSAAEELETGKEELQSVNEELTTVNQELKIKINELAQTNHDFQNLIAATEIGTIFLDADLRVKFSTPSARAVFNLQDSDIGRPLSDITSQLLKETLHDDVRTVLERLAVIDREIQAKEGRWYLIRVRPYRSGDVSTGGVVITFLDITERHSAERRAREGEERLRLLVDSALDYAIFTTKPDGRIDFWNNGAQRMFGYTHDEIIGRDMAMLFTPEDRAEQMPEEARARALRNGRAADQRFHLRKDGSRFYCSGVLTALGDGRGFAQIARDISALREVRASGGPDASLNDGGRDVTERLQAQSRETAIAHAEAARRIVNAQETERGRIARDLHDSLGQMLTALRMTLESVRTQAGGTEIGRALELANAVDRELDFLAWELRPSVLEELGLAAALPRFVKEWSQHYALVAKYRSAFEPGQLSSEGEVAFYRVAQAALDNIAKHAKATRVDVILEGRDGTVVLVVEDDGVGFDVADEQAHARRFGLVGMRERAALAGATLQIESTPGSGTSVFLRCPIDQGPRA